MIRQKKIIASSPYRSLRTGRGARQTGMVLRQVMRMMDLRNTYPISANKTGQCSPVRLLNKKPVILRRMTRLAKERLAASFQS